MVLSVIIPALNEEHYLPDVLKDLQNQTEKKFEVIIVDGKSEDKTKEKALSFSKHLNLLFLESPKRNVAHQRNLGVKKAKGAYLLFLDSDTRIEKNTVEKIQDHIKEEKKLLYLPFPKPDISGILPALIFKVAIHAVVFLQRFGKPFSFGPGIIIERQLFDSIGGFDEKAYVAEDHGLIIKAYKKGIKATFLPDVKYVFSTRRGMLKIAWQYLIFSIMTFFKGVIYTKSIKYEMGGHNFKKDSK